MTRATITGATLARGGAVAILLPMVAAMLFFIDVAFAFGVITIAVVSLSALFAVVGVQWLVWRLLFPDLLDAARGAPPAAP